MIKHQGDLGKYLWSCRRLGQPASSETEWKSNSLSSAVAVLERPSLSPLLLLTVVNVCDASSKGTMCSKVLGECVCVRSQILLF